MKKAILLLVAVLVVLGLIGSVAACKGGTTTPTTTTKPTTTTTTKPTTTKPTTTTPTTITPTTTKTTQATTTATTTASSGIPTIPHSLTGRDDCLLCHKTGVGGAQPVPASHASYTNAMCLSCHKVQ